MVGMEQGRQLLLLLLLQVQGSPYNCQCYGLCRVKRNDWKLITHTNLFHYQSEVNSLEKLERDVSEAKVKLN